MRLSDFDVLSFDCYGTLIDWESGILSAALPLMSRARDPNLLLEAFGRHESRLEAANPQLPYSEILVKVYGAIAEEWGLETSEEERHEFGASVGNWPAFPDSAAALAYLKRHYALAILSNVDRESFIGSNARLGVDFDFVFTAQDIGSYKPDPRNFEYLVSKLEKQGYSKGRILHVAESLFHDHGPANKIGLASAWIHRRHAAGGFGATAPPVIMPSYNFRFTSMAEMAQAHREESN